MLPLRVEYRSSRFPWMNYALIAVNIVVYLFEIQRPAFSTTGLYQFALIPAQVTTSLDAGDVLRVFSSMFMHAGLAHIAGNMLYLWIFGGNVEEAMGPFRYLAFYLLGGVLASVTHILTNPASRIPTVGASGAIAAVLGAYLILFPRSRVLTLVVLGFFYRLVMIPATIMLGLWVILQLFEGVLTLGGPEMGGVAFWAHIGGFVAGLLLAKLFARYLTYYDWIHGSRV